MASISSSKALLRTINPVPTVTMVGEAQTTTQLQEIFQELAPCFSAAIDPICTPQIGLNFGRDWRVRGLNDIHLIPYCLQASALQCNALLPSSTLIQVQRDEATGNDTIIVHGYGNGFTRDNTQAALRYAKMYDLPFRQMRCTVEGGNAHVFFQNETPKAIVGAHSLCLTLVGLEEQNYFKQELISSFASRLEAVDTESIRRARNYALYQELMKQVSTIDDDSTHDKLLVAFYKRIQAKVTDEERVIYDYEGKLWLIKYIFAKKVIAEDLGVSHENLAVLEQRAFHIDMETLVDPSGQVVYLDSSVYTPFNQLALEKIGCRPVQVKGVFPARSPENPSIYDVNFLNGLFFPSGSAYLYVTNGIEAVNRDKLSALEKIFKEESPCPIFTRLVGTPLILTKYMGGIRCMTWERPVYTTPLDIIGSYLADVPVAEKTLKEKIRGLVPRGFALSVGTQPRE